MKMRRLSSFLVVAAMAILQARWSLAVDGFSRVDRGSDTLYSSPSGMQMSVSKARFSSLADAKKFCADRGASLADFSMTFAFEIDDQDDATLRSAMGVNLTNGHDHKAGMAVWSTDNEEPGTDVLFMFDGEGPEPQEASIAAVNQQLQAAGQRPLSLPAICTISDGPAPIQDPNSVVNSQMTPADPNSQSPGVSERTVVVVQNGWTCYSDRTCDGYGQTHVPQSANSAQ